MHILEIPSFFPPHGGLFCLEQAKALKQNGNEVRILSCELMGISVDGKDYFSSSFGRKWVEYDGIEVYRSYVHGIPKLLKYNVNKWINTVESMYNDYCLKYGNPDIIHAHCCKIAGIAANIISKKKCVPYVITEHLPSEIYAKEFGELWNKHVWLKEMITESFNNASCVIPVAGELIEDIAPYFGKDYKYRIISNIIDTDFFAYKEREPLNKRKYKYCCIAIADIHRKGYDILARAFSKISNAELYIVGKGTDKQDIKQLFGGNNNVFFYGNLDKQGVRDLLYKCDSLVLASRSEAQPLVILEAISTGIPVVSTEVVPISERIDNACFIAPIGNADELRKRMLEVQQVTLDENIHQNIEKLASKKVVATQIEEVFKKCYNQI